MARKDQPNTTIEQRLEELAQLIDTNERETQQTAARLAADPGDAAALRQLTDLRRERANLDATREALELAQAKRAELEAQATEEGRAARVAELRVRVDELLARRAEVAQRLAAAFEALAKPLADYQLVAQDLRATVFDLHRLVGDSRMVPPDTAPSSTDAALLAALHAAGLGRTGPRLQGRVSVQGPTNRVTLAEAIERDDAYLRGAVARMLAPPTNGAPTPWYQPMHDVERARREHQAADVEAAARGVKRDMARAAERTAQLMRDAARPISRDASGKIVLAEAQS